LKHRKLVPRISWAAKKQLLRHNCGESMKNGLEWSRLAVFSRASWWTSSFEERFHDGEVKFCDCYEIITWRVEVCWFSCLTWPSLGWFEKKSKMNFRKECSTVVLTIGFKTSFLVLTQHSISSINLITLLRHLQ
jgi:hypothetical protein